MSGTFSNGFVVPNVIKEANGGTTTVGLMNNSESSIPVYWTFHNQESGHVADGCFVMTAKDYEPFVWADRAGTGMDGYRGYLVFAVGTTATGAGAPPLCGTADAAATLAASGPILAGSAFYVDPVNKDVAFTPVIDGPLTIPAGNNLTTLGPDSVTAVGGAASLTTANNQTFAMRYFVDGAPGGNDTAIVVWSTGDQRGTYTVNMFDNAQNRRSVNFQLDHAELDWFNPETIAGRPSTFVDGFISWMPKAAAVSGIPSGVTRTHITARNTSVFTYSVISAPAFGAVQTVLGAHTIR
ncbi:hypothetical protein ACFSF0_06170 [Ottowia flava]|uniref:Uncharacterized protein n=1 Tax=Ottowia flava TaxID=2675430 RepID=A0ABW4KQM1_9BURK